MVYSLLEHVTMSCLFCSSSLKQADKATGKYYKMKDKYVGTLINIFGSNVEQNNEYSAFL
jgi:hypothetical protein